MKNMLFLVLVLGLLVFTVGCDTELGHVDHDHDHDGVQDHTAEEHDPEEEVDLQQDLDIAS
jgi:hypothetical protein